MKVVGDPNMSDGKVLVASVGDVLLGDDAFGVCALRALEKRGTPRDVRLADYGSHSGDLAAEIQNGYKAVILLEAASWGGAPGTLYVFDPQIEPVEAGQAIFASRNRSPVDGLRVLDALDEYDGRIYIIGCEPESFESVDSLSDSVASAVTVVVPYLESLLNHVRTSSGPRKAVPSLPDRASAPTHSSQRLDAKPVVA